MWAMISVWPLIMEWERIESNSDRVKAQNCGPGLTAHAVEKYVERFERKEVKAWREISRIAGDGKLAKLEGRNVLHDIKHRRQGSYVLDSKREVMLVIAKPDRVGDLPRLVTIVRPDSNAKVFKD